MGIEAAKTDEKKNPYKWKRKHTNIKRVAHTHELKKQESIPKQLGETAHKF